MASLPSCIVTFLFTDIKSSTQRWKRQREAMSPMADLRCKRWTEDTTGAKRVSPMCRQRGAHSLVLCRRHPVT
jgi:hypothetical protein